MSGLLTLFLKLFKGRFQISVNAFSKISYSLSNNLIRYHTYSDKVETVCKFIRLVQMRADSSPGRLIDKGWPELPPLAFPMMMPRFSDLNAAAKSSAAEYVFGPVSTITGLL